MPLSIIEHEKIWKAKKKHWIYTINTKRMQTVSTDVFFQLVMRTVNNVLILLVLLVLLTSKHPLSAALTQRIF